MHAPIDWYVIEKRYRMGESAGAISSDVLINVTKQGIQQHANRNGWKRYTDNERQQVEANSVAPVASAIPSVKAYAEPVTKSEQIIASFGKRSPATLRAILENIEDGMTKVLACKAVGVDRDTLLAWCKDDGHVSAAITLAEANRARARTRKMEEAGDWKAAQAMLEVDPFSKEVFGQAHGAGGNITVVLNINRDTITVEPKVIEHGSE